MYEQDSTGTASGASPGAPAAEEHITLSQAAKLAPGRPSSNCVWRWCREGVLAKTGERMGAFEVCFYGWKEGAAHHFFGPKNVTDLWPIKKVNPQSMVHLTEKPLALAARAIQYSSKPGENVLDLFGGSGSTLMAAEQMDRHAYLMELDPAYCDVIVQRWQNATGEAAVRDGDGATFAEVCRVEKQEV